MIADASFDRAVRTRGTEDPRACAQLHRHHKPPAATIRYMFRLVVTVRRGSACNLVGAWEKYATIETARSAGTGLLRHERVLRIAIVRNEAPPAFVEWLEK